MAIKEAISRIVQYVFPILENTEPLDSAFSSFLRHFYVKITWRKLGVILIVIKQLQMYWKAQTLSFPMYFGLFYDALYKLVFFSFYVRVALNIYLVLKPFVKKPSSMVVHFSNGESKP